MIGAGFGGLAAAIDLASRGFRVRVLEAADAPGGKASVAVVDGVEFDTGPSVLTLPGVFDDVFRLAGTSLRHEVELVEPDPAFRYLWPDGTALDVAVSPDVTLANVRRTLGREAEGELASFLAYAKHIWDVVETRFVVGPAPTFRGMLSFSALRDLGSIDAMRSMQQGIETRVRSPHLRMLLSRYATYNGSDPRRAPGTLNCIAHVELALGGFGVKGGIRALVVALVRTAERLGVELCTRTPVRRILTRDGRVVGVVTDAGEERASVVVANADVAHVFGTLTDLPPPKAQRSTSGWTGVVRARRGACMGGPRVAHTVLFPRDYTAEFADLFDGRRPPREPTVYLCAQEAAHQRTGWLDAEPVFLMANAPADPSLPVDGLRDTVLARSVGAGLLRADDDLVWDRTPADLAARFPGSLGALYGAASNDAFAAFRRPANRVAAVRGLYLASGGAHPGGGMPLCALSGRAAAQAAAEDLA